ncbi:Uncharacterised protein [Vibrio cholerae]|nr:Uncharacterised protein [Vibrio cholerae]
MVKISDHQFNRCTDLPHPLVISHRLSITTTNSNIIEDPFLVTFLLIDIVGNGNAHPLITITQSSPTRH